MADNVVTLVPPSGLVTQDAEGKTLFCLFTEDWLSLQTFIVQTLALPIAKGHFEDKYGTFADEQDVENCVAAMKALQALSTQFGDPASLVRQLAEDPAVLQTDTAPEEVYTHIVWFATKLYQAANTYNQTLDELVTLLNPANCGDKESCAAVLKDILVGKRGLQSTAEDMVTKANALVKAMAHFDTELKPRVDTMTKYTAHSSQFRQDVDNAIGKDAQNIDTYQAAVNHAHKVWRDYTISATTTSVGVMVLSGGLAWPVAAALAGGLGKAAADARKAYDKVCNQLHAAQADKKKKILLKHDLGALNSSMEPTSKAATEFMSVLEKALGVWSTTSNNIAYIAQNFTPEQLGDLMWVSQALELERATKDWGEIAKASKEYTANSLVSFMIQELGSKLPEAA
jgi:hypothetical protein